MAVANVVVIVAVVVAVVVVVVVVVISPDELIVGRFFSCYEIIQTVCVFCALSSSVFGTTNLRYNV